MGSKRELARKLGAIAGFDDPSVALEQYATPTEVAAHLVHLADLEDDVRGRTVVDLGTGTGVFALAASLRGASPSIGLDVDPNALAAARTNEERIAPPTPIEWLLADATRPPLRPSDATVLMNPPFGAQRGREHVDRRFLATAAEIARVSYSIHNAGSRSFVESFASDNGGTVTHAFEVSFDVDHQFPFHRDATRALQVEAYRIEWNED
jgi:putative methylase